MGEECAESARREARRLQAESNAAFAERRDPARKEAPLDWCEQLAKTVVAEERSKKKLVAARQENVEMKRTVEAQHIKVLKQATEIEALKNELATLRNIVDAKNVAVADGTEAAVEVHELLSKLQVIIGEESELMREAKNASVDANAVVIDARLSRDSVRSMENRRKRILSAIQG